jgi:hypothetical protein
MKFRVRQHLIVSARKRSELMRKATTAITSRARGRLRFDHVPPWSVSLPSRLA